jgi:hypothetical protein
MEEQKHSIILTPSSIKLFLNFIALAIKKLTRFNLFTSKLRS